MTAAFNLNLLERINRELDADFDLDRFEHVAFYNEAAGRIEIYIRSLADQIVTVAGRAIRFAAGERIHTEYSYKYAVAEFRAWPRAPVSARRLDRSGRPVQRPLSFRT